MINCDINSFAQQLCICSSWNIIWVVNVMRTYPLHQQCTQRSHPLDSLVLKIWMATQLIWFYSYQCIWWMNQQSSEKDDIWDLYFGIPQTIPHQQPMYCNLRYAEQSVIWASTICKSNSITSQRYIYKCSHKNRKKKSERPI